MDKNSTRKENLFKYLDALEKDIITEKQFYDLVDLKFNTIGKYLIEYLSKDGVEDKDKIFNHIIAEQKKYNCDSYASQVMCCLLKNDTFSKNEEKRNALIFTGKNANELFRMGMVYANDMIWNDKELLSLFENSSITDEMERFYVTYKLLKILEDEFFKDGKNKNIFKKMVTINNIEGIKEYFDIVKLNSIITDEELQNHFLYLLSSPEYASHLRCNDFSKSLKYLDDFNKIKNIRQQLLALKNDKEKTQIYKWDWFRVKELANQLEKNQKLQDDELFNRTACYKSIHDMFRSKELLQYDYIINNMNIYNIIMKMEDVHLKCTLTNLCKYEEIMSDEDFVSELSTLASEKAIYERIELRAKEVNCKSYFEDKIQAFSNNDSIPIELVSYINKRRNLSKEQLLDIRTALSGSREDFCAWYKIKVEEPSLTTIQTEGKKSKGLRKFFGKNDR